jgi:hypothetical protein
LALRASVERVSQIPPGVYLGDAVHRRPREGSLGESVNRIGLITLTVEMGTN